MLGSVFATVYESLRIVSPSKVNSATWRRKPVIRLTRLATAIRLLERPSDCSLRGTTTNCSVGLSSGGGPLMGSGRGAAEAPGQGAGAGRPAGDGAPGGGRCAGGGPGTDRRSSPPVCHGRADPGWGAAG